MNTEPTTPPPHIHAALAEVMTRIGGIGKDETNREQNFKFRSIDAITAHVRPMFGAVGISIAPKVLDLTHTEIQSKSGTRGYRAVATVQYILTAAADGSEMESVMTGEAVDYGDKSTSKAVQMAYKYMLTEVLAIGSGGDDEADTHSVEMGESVSAPRRRTATKPSAAPVSSYTNEAKLGLLRAVNNSAEMARHLWTQVAANYGLAVDDDCESAGQAQEILTECLRLLREEGTVQRETFPPSPFDGSTEPFDMPDDLQLEQP